MGCDGDDLPPVVEEPWPFSILERIEWAATSPDPAWTHILASFSILERIEWAATHGRPGLARERDPLSVSSNGSNGLRPLCRPVRHACRALSVSSNGSNGLRRRPSCSSWIPARFFQYPRTDRMGCDSAPAMRMNSSPASFQYPRTDRMGCDPSCLVSLSVSSNGSNGLRRSAVVRPLSLFALSVSSNGSNGLRLHKVARRRRCRRDFQYPRTDRMGCDA